MPLWIDSSQKYFEERTFILSLNDLQSDVSQSSSGQATFKAPNFSPTTHFWWGGRSCKFFKSNIGGGRGQSLMGTLILQTTKQISIDDIIKIYIIYESEKAL